MPKGCANLIRVPPAEHCLAQESSAKLAQGAMDSVSRQSSDAGILMGTAVR